MFNSFEDAPKELATLRAAVKRMQLKVEYWGEGEFMTLNEHGPVGMTLSKAEAEAVRICNVD